MRNDKINSIVLILCMFLALNYACNIKSKDTKTVNSLVKTQGLKKCNSLDTLKLIEYACSDFLKHYYKCFKIKPDTVYLLQNATLLNTLPYFNRAHAFTYWKYTLPENAKHLASVHSPAVNCIMWLHAVFPEVIWVSFFPEFKNQADFNIRYHLQSNQFKTDMQSSFVYLYRADSVFRFHLESQTSTLINYKSNTSQF